MTEWILTICTAGWVLCGQRIEQNYPSEQACYRALDELYKRHGSKEFKWVTCAPTPTKHR